MGKQKINAAQKQHMQQFQGITGASKDQALECLQATQWNVEVAVNHFFNAGLTGAPPKDNSAVVSLYGRYKDQQTDAIMAEGISPCCCLPLPSSWQPWHIHLRCILQVLVDFVKT